MTDVLARGAAHAAQPDTTIVATILDLPLDLMLIIVLLAGLCFQTLTIIYLYSQLKQKRAEEGEGADQPSGADRGCSDHPDAVVVRLDAGGLVADMSAGARLFFGARGEDSLGRPFLGGLVPTRESTGRDLAAVWHELTRSEADRVELECEALVEGRKRIWMRWRLRRQARAKGRTEADPKAGPNAMPELGPGLGGSEWLCLGQETTRDRERERSLLQASLSLEQTVDGVVLAALDGTILFANAAWKEMHGFPDNDDMLGQSLAMFHSPEQMIQEVIPFNREVVRTGFKRGEVGHVRRDGTSFISQMTSSLVLDEQGEPMGYVAVARDGTEERRQRDELKRALAWLTSLAESTDAAVMVADRSARPQFYNSAYAELVEKVLGLAMEPGVQALEAMDEETRTLWEGWCRQVLGGEHLRFQRDVSFLDGTTHRYDVSMHPVVQEGEMVGLSVFFTEAKE